MPQPNYYLAMPVHVASGVVFASPHSGRDYAESFLQKNTPRIITFSFEEHVSLWRQTTGNR